MICTLIKNIICVISYTCSLSNSDGSVLKTEPSELDWLQVYDMYIDVLKTIFHQCVISYTCSQSNSDGSVLKTEPSELDWRQVYDMYIDEKLF